MCKLWICMLTTTAVLIVTAAIIALLVNIHGIKIILSPSNDVHTPRPYGRNFIDGMSSDNVYHIATNSDSKYTANTNSTSSLEDQVVKSWPKIFVLSSDPAYPVVCYAGLTLNATDRNINVTETSNQDVDTARSSISKRSTSKLFILSADPKFPVICQEGNIPPGLAPDRTLEEDNTDTNTITCIRRDYEGDISAIFLQNAGPIETAWNVFNSSIPYGFWNVGNEDSIDDTSILRETIVDCNGFSFEIGDKTYIISKAAAESLGG